MRAIDTIILHCSATEQGKEFNTEDIREWHLGRGWKDVGYHFVILLDGTIEIGRPVHQVGSHVKGQNQNSIGVCYIGGLVKGKAKDTMTDLQASSFLFLVKAIRTIYGNEIMVSGHNEYDSKKECPSFIVKEKFPNINQLEIWN